MSELFTEKYFPNSFDEFIGNSEIVVSAQEWAGLWNNNKKQVPLLLWGHTGAGKTCLAQLIAKKFDWDLFELNASDLRSKEVIDKIVSAAAQNTSFSGKKRLILLDEIDGMQSADKGGNTAIASLLKESQNPVILTANEIYGNKKMQGIRLQSKNLEFKKINFLSIAKRLREICAKEKVLFEEEALKELAKNSEGDFRSALLDLQTLCLNKSISLTDIESLGLREHQQKIFSVMKHIFKGKNFNEIREARIASDLSFDMLSAWIEENIPRQYTNAKDNANAFNYLSKADLFQGRIRKNQNWELFRYTTELATAGVALCRENEYSSFTPYQFPTILSRLSKSTGLRSLKKGIGLKVGAKMHSSSREIISSDMPFIKMILKSDKQKAVNFSAEFDLTDKEIAFLLDTKPDTMKVKKIIEEADELKKQMISSKSSKVFSNFQGKQIAEELIEMEEEKEEPELKKEKPKEEGKQMKLF
ncbi:MAG: replication factor C large subunit [Candidatus Diapherotrites archaeon]|nr:replication factor C large subunit [Candidatus Diapherotrites archaeon]